MPADCLKYLFNREDGKVPVTVQGITGKMGSFHTKLMLEYGTNVAMGVTPGKAGHLEHSIPVFNHVADALVRSGSRISIIFVPAPFFLGAAKEALDAGVKLLVAITERVPVRDTLATLELANRVGATVIGPNTPGVIVPGLLKIGIMPHEPFSKGNIAVFSRSGTLTYEVAYYLTKGGRGQSIALGIGGDPINCTTLIDCLEWAMNDIRTEGVVIIGEIGGSEEERAAQYIKETKYTKPVAAYIAGRHAPKEKKMGHAGAIIYGSSGTAESKVNAFRDAGIPVAQRPSMMPETLKEAFQASR